MPVYNISKIEYWYNTFTSCNDRFKKNYEDLNSSYIKASSDANIKKIYDKLNKHYARINRIYKNINNVWKDYLSDLNATENALAGKGGAGRIKASIVSSKISKLPKLPDYKSDISIKLSSLNSSTGAVKKLGISENRTLSKNISYAYKRAYATVGTAVVSVIEGATDIVEGVIDAASATICEGIAKVPVFFTACMILLSNDTENIQKWSKKMNEAEEFGELLMEESRAFVSYDIVGSSFSVIYEETGMKDDAFAFDTVRSMGCEMSQYVICQSVDKIAPGIGSAIYGVSKFGKHLETNWQDPNADTDKAFVKSFYQGAGDTAFFMLNSKMDSMMKNAMGKYANNLGRDLLTSERVISLGGKATVEGVVNMGQSGSEMFIDALFLDNTITDSNGNVITFKSLGDKLKYSYQQAGGSRAFAQDFAIGFGGSIIGDMDIAKNFNLDDFNAEKAANNAMKAGVISDSISAKNIGKYSAEEIESINPKNIEVSSNVKNASVNDDLDDLKKEYDELLNKTKEPWFIKAKNASDNGYAWDYYKIRDAEDIVKRIAELEDTLNIKETKTSLNNVKSEINTNMDDLSRQLKQSNLNTATILKQNGYDVKIGMNSTDFDVAVEVGSLELYYITKLKSVGMYENFGKGAQFDIARLEAKVKPYLNEDDLINIKKIKDVSSKSNVTTNQKATIFQYQEAGGYEINAYKRGYKGGQNYRKGAIFKKSWEDISNLEDAINKHPKNAGNHRLKIKGESFIDTMDDVLENNSIKTTVVSSSYFRSMNTIYNTDEIFDAINKFGANSKEVADMLNAAKGMEITDKGYRARTIPPTKKTSYFNNLENKVEVRSYILPGCGTYADSISNRYALGEVIVKPNCREITTDAFIDPKTGRLVFETVILPPVESGVSYSNLFNQAKKGISIDTLNAEIKGNSELSKRINDAMTELHSKGLYDGRQSLAYHGYDHVENVSKYSIYIAEKMGLNPRKKEMIKDCAMYHDVGVVENPKYASLKDAHRDHGIRSVAWAGDDLSKKYTLEELNKIKAVIELHEISGSSENKINDVLRKYNIVNSNDVADVKELSSILKDADALDRARFPGGSESLDPNRLKNNVSKDLAKASFQNVELQSSNKIDKILSSNSLPQSDIQSIIELRNTGNYSDHVLLFASENYRNKRIQASTGCTTLKQYADYITKYKKWT